MLFYIGNLSLNVFLQITVLQQTEMKTWDVLKSMNKEQRNYTWTRKTSYIFWYIGQSVFTYSFAFSGP